MSIFRNDTLGSWTRGGQAIVHNVRMTTQVFFQTTLAGLSIWVIGAIWYAFEKSDAYQRFVLTKLIEANFKADAAPGTNDPVLFRTPDGREYWTSADWLVDSVIAKQALEKLESDLIGGAILSGVFALAALVFAWFYFTRTGKVPMNICAGPTSGQSVRYDARFAAKRRAASRSGASTSRTLLKPSMF
jgi:hypothetical protein